MDLSSIPAEFRHLFREQDDPVDFAKIAAEKNRPPSPEIRALFNQREPDFQDTREMLTANAMGLPAASMTKGTIDTMLAKRFIEANGVQTSEARHALALGVYYSKHAGEPGVTLTERLQGLVDKAVNLLCPEDAELLIKAARALDMHLVAFFLEKAFCPVEV